MSNLKGRKIYVVLEFDANDMNVGYEIFANQKDADERVNYLLNLMKKNGQVGNVYVDADTIS